MSLKLNRLNKTFNIVSYFILVFFIFSFLQLINQLSAAQLTSQSLNLSRINENTSAVHILSFVATSGIPPGEEITISYPPGFIIGGSYDYNDVSLEEGDSGNCLTASYSTKTLGASPSGAVWGFSIAGPDLTFTSGTDTITAGRCVRITLLDNGTGRNITNPAVSSDELFNVSILSASFEYGEVAAIILDDPSTPDGDQIEINGAVLTTILLDIDTVLAGCDNSTEVSLNTVDMGVLFPGSINQSNATTTNFICLDIGTNASNGVKVFVQSNRNNSVGGLVSGGNTIVSSTSDLNLVATSEGYGLRVSSVGTPALGAFSAVAPFNNGTSGSVGLVPGILASPAEIVSASIDSRTGVASRVAIEVAAKASGLTPPGNYTDILTFTALVNL